MAKKNSKKTTNAVMNQVIQSPKQELDKKIETQEQIDSLVTMTQDLIDMRKRASMQARMNDIKYVKQIDEFMGTVLEAITEDKEVLKTAIVNVIKQGKMTQFKHLMTALGIATDKRQMLLGFDETRDSGKQNEQKLQLQVVWENEKGGKMGVNASVSNKK